MSCTFDVRLRTLLACLHAKSLSCIQLFMTPWTIARQAPLSVGFSSQEHWSGLQRPPPGNRPDSGSNPWLLRLPARTGGIFTTRAAWEAQELCLALDIKGSERLLIRFFWKLPLLSFTLKSMVRFELIFIHGVRFQSRFIFLFIFLPLVPFVKQSALPPLNCFCVFVVSQLSTFVWVCLGSLSAPLIRVSTPLQTPPSLPKKSWAETDPSIFSFLFSSFLRFSI